MLSASRPTTYPHPLLLKCCAAGYSWGYIRISCSRKPASKVASNLSPISEESVQTWIQDSSVSQPVKCEMPPCMFCCRQERGRVWIIRVAFVLVSGPHQHCLMVGPGGCKNSSLNCWILPGLQGEGLILETFACIGTFCTDVQCHDVFLVYFASRQPETSFKLL